ncbi:MAG: ASKHA domain-containing protein, partial [Desulfobacterales bacterium]|nr:ASKHA domain-containing protein [Desulfobacterales bacterium]
ACGREKGLNPLHGSVIKNINSLIKTLTDEKEVNVEDITAIVAAGNTTMSHLLLSLIPCSIRLDPYVPTANIFPQIRARDLNIDINPVGILETIADVASYVGGDIVAGILACGMADRPETRVLIDVGTNGEIAIGNNEWMVCCSASAGPAFEGGGIKNGMRATRGAIERITISNGDITYETIGKAKPRGICGSGLIDCIYEFARARIIDHDGKFNLSANNGRIIEKDGGAQFILAYSQETESGEDLTISESDIANLIRSKGAVFAAIKSLMDYVGLKFEDIETFFVAGGFGSYLDIPKAIGIGLLPDIDPKRIRFIGNSSLMGARLALLSGHAFERTIHIANSMTNIEMSTYQPFMDEYVAAMFLPHTDRRLFPSVHY